VTTHSLPSGPQSSAAVTHDTIQSGGAAAETSGAGAGNADSRPSHQLGGPAVLAFLTNLTSLHINTSTCVTQDASPALKQAQLLEQLQLAAALRGMTKLQSLRLEHLPPQPIADALQHLTGLTALRIGGRQSTERPCAIVLPSLKLLEVGGWGGVGGDGLPEHQACQQMLLSCHRTFVSKPQPSDMQSAVPTLHLHCLAFILPSMPRLFSCPALPHRLREPWSWSGLASYQHQS
jgi:hypothetical protein